MKKYILTIYSNNHGEDPDIWPVLIKNDLKEIEKQQELFRLWTKEICGDIFKHKTDEEISEFDKKFREHPLGFTKVLYYASIYDFYFYRTDISSIESEFIENNILE